MKTIILASFILCLHYLNLVEAASTKVKAYDLNAGQEMTLEELSEKLSPGGYFVLGEYHYDEAIQLAQASFIQSMVKVHQHQGNFSVNWEFLNYPDQKEITKYFHQYRNNEITGDEFLKLIGQEKAKTYLPIFATTKAYAGELNGVNAPRTVKRRIVKDGLSSLEPHLVPPNMAMGSDHYLERFKEAMGGHVGDEQLRGYFEAQCYTDSVMAWYMREFSQYPMKFLVVGSFHSDYSMGTVESLRNLTGQPVQNLKFVDKTKLGQQEWEELTKPSPKYGSVASYLVFVD